jgi:hypothetical protein
MFLSGKEIIFFILTFVVLFFFSKGALLMGPKMKLGNTVSLLIMSFLGALLLILVYKFGKIAHCQADGFHFEVTPAKKCQGFPYMQSSDPELLNYCGKLLSTPRGRREYDMVNCRNPGYLGRPVTFDRTSMSNDMWENEMCNPPYVNAKQHCVL